MPTRINAVLTAESAHTVNFGLAPMANAVWPAGANRVVYCLGMEEFQEQFGWSDDFLTFTLCGAAYSMFVLKGIRGVTFCNVLDAENEAHTEDVTEETTARQRFGNPRRTEFGRFGVLADSVKLYLTDTLGQKIGQPLTEGEDYTLSTQNWQLGFSPVMGGAIFAANPGETEVTLAAEYTCVNPAGVQISDVIGGYENGKRSGIECAKDVWPVTKHAPSILAAPGWSRYAAVYAALGGMCDMLNRRWDCTFVADIDSGETGARRWQEVFDAKDKAAQNDHRSMTFWPCCRSGDYILWGSSVLSSLMNEVDARSGSPFESPSNKDMGVSGFCLEDGTEINLTDEEANELNPQGITTGIFDRGLYVAWGNYSASGQSTTDPQYMWHNLVRFVRWKQRSFTLTYRQFLDMPLSGVKVRTILAMENERILGEVNRGISPGGELLFNGELNDATTILNGEAVFSYRWSTWIPMQSIMVEFEFAYDILVQALKEVAA